MKMGKAATEKQICKDESNLAANYEKPAKIL